MKLCVLFSLALVGLAACVPSPKSAIDVATAACEGEQASVVVQRDPEGKIVDQACLVEEEVAPWLHAVVGAHKKGLKFRPPEEK